MKLRIFLTNLFIAFFLFLTCEFYVYSSELKNMCITQKESFFDIYTQLPLLKYQKWLKNLIHNYDDVFFDQDLGYIPFNTSSEDFVDDESKNNKPILLFGCSYAWGANTPANLNFSSKLRQYTHRKVYNRAIPGTGISHSLFMLQNGIEKTIENPEYVIFLYQKDHIRRLDVFCSFFEKQLVFYKLKNEKLTLVNDLEFLHWHSYMLRRYSSYTHSKNFELDYERKVQLLKLHFIEINNQIRKKVQNSNFVVFVYSGDEHLKLIEKELFEQGIKIVYLSDLSDINFRSREYLLSDNDHPNQKTWEVITPLIVKELNL